MSLWLIWVRSSQDTFSRMRSLSTDGSAVANTMVCNAIA